MSKHGSSDTGNLIVYRASAGSGKTHQLTGEFLRLLFSVPYTYRHILAVTFTNKATDEMKTRIIDELSNLANNQKSDYIDLLKSPRLNTEEKIRGEALTILQHILHDYSAFSVSTIDRFFQQTMRAFTRELGLSGGYNVELDTEKVLTEAIDTMLMDLEKNGNRQLLEWLIRFSEEKIENGETWNIRNDIGTLSREIFKESFKAHSDDVQKDISDKKLMDDYKSMLRMQISTFRNTSKKIGEKALNIMSRHGLQPEDFKNGSRSPFRSFLTWAQGEIKEPSKTFGILAGDVSVWYKNTDKPELKSRIEDAFSDGLNACVCDIIEHYQNSETYQTAAEINRYFFTLGILGDVDKKIRENSAEKNIMLISDTTELLHKIIKGSDTPFIYEKIGTYIDHYMIDEFQDTSGMQWTNFSPLIKDSLDAGKQNLIVGDVKQSIYRWRNSDWTLLDEKLQQEFRNGEISDRPLDINWRSLKNVVQFNNAVFTEGAKVLQALYNSSLPDEVPDELKPFEHKILNAYKTARQQISPKKTDETGHVKVNFWDKDEYPDWKAKSLEELPKQIEELQDKGYSLKDIAILVRTKNEGAEIANTLLEYKGNNPNSKYKFDIISDEALYLNASKSVKLIVSLLRYLQKPTDVSLKTLAVYEYYKFKNKLSSEEALNLYFSTAKNFSEQTAEKLRQIRELPLYEMIEQIFDLFRDAMEENENIYIQSFLDIILDFTVKNTSDLNAFLLWWDASGSGKTIFTPDGQDAIRIMTVHKSKGLGFNVVLIPFCHWELDSKPSTILWCQPKTEPFNKLHLVPLKYTQALKNTIFAHEYYDEKLHAFVDNLNILYVAFTRAKKELIAFAPKPGKKGEIKNVSTLLWHCIDNSVQITEKTHDEINLNEYFDEENQYFEIGKDHLPILKSDKWDKEKEISIGSLASIPFNDRLRLRLKNKYYFADTGQRDYGNMMHDILSKIKVSADLENAANTYFQEGIITQDEISDLLEELSGYLSNKSVSEWYSGKYRVLNEVQILQPKGTFVRPDRVMLDENKVVVVDYKFGEQESKKYEKQVSFYIDQIRKMGYENVEGYIWYVKLKKVVSV